MMRPEHHEIKVILLWLVTLTLGFFLIAVMISDSQRKHTRIYCEDENSVVPVHYASSNLTVVEHAEK